MAADVCAVLGIAHAASAVRSLYDDERNTVRLMHGNRGNPRSNIISESGLYKLVLRSDKPEARAFQDWVTRHVLPAINRDGMYVKGEEKVLTGEMSLEEPATTTS